MKKQVTFAESGTVHALRQDAALHRKHESNAEMKSRGLNIRRRLDVKHEPLHRHTSQIHIPKTMTLAPFLKHTALTPAQREYLYAVAASCSAAHVRNLISQHYVNVLHRRVRTEFDAEEEEEEDDAVFPAARHCDKLQSEAKHKHKINTKARNPGKSFPPKTHSRRVRFSNTFSSKQGKVKKRRTSPRLRRKSPKRSRVQLLEDEDENEDEDEEGRGASLSESLSSLSVADWEDDGLSDIQRFS
ncbi:uncharacterized protein V6R79_026149 [Siganus canaliculatus]